jgi:hypothetical protein
VSNTLFAFLKKLNVPSQNALQASIDALGFDLKIDPDMKLLVDTGFSPCQLNGVGDVGFELLYEDSKSLIAGNEEFRFIAGENDVCISFSWGGRMKDFACVMIVSCALAKDFDAVVTYEGQEPGNLADMLAATAEIIEYAMNESGHETAR